MMHNQFLLLKDRRFLPLFVTQFFGAFHDNLFKNALIILILYRIATATGMDEQTQALLTTAAAGTLVLPFFIFSALGGQLADKFPKFRVIRVIKLVEIGIAFLGAAALWSESLTLCFLNLFALGTHSAFFGPCKYSILPEKLRQDELIGGNALLNTGTFLAILLGTIAGLSLMAQDRGEHLVGAIMVIISLIGYIAARYIPEHRAANAVLKFNLNPLTETWKVLKHSFSGRRDIVVSMLGKGWFFCTGSLFLSQFPNYVKNTLGAEENVLTMFTVLFSVGIGIGGLFNNKLLRGEISASLVPFAAIGIAIFGTDLYFATNYALRAEDGELMTLSIFASHLAHWRIIADTVLLSMSSGLFVVPLATILQDRTDEALRARTMAGSAIIDSLFMVSTAVAAGILISAGFEIRELFLAFSLISLAVAAAIRALLPK
jgi:acyl-[acyl-carrier-protein]-phospholipid O-acyltransferase/long-chain-fatty-acid--[acyl-carrier-protein] ligase